MTALERRLRRRVARDPLLRAVREAAAATGVPVRLVGGLVRDEALGRPAADVDLAAGPRASALVRRLEEDWHGRAFRVRRRGVTTWRWSVGGREVDLVDVGRGGFERDLQRRDFRVNAIAFDPVGGRLEDPLRGLRDLAAGRLRVPRPGVVREDPVRAVRAARFVAALPGARLDPATRREVLACAPRLGRAPAERVRQELDAMLLSAAPPAGLRAMERWGLLARVLPELLPMRSCVAGGGRPDVLEHTLAAIGESLQQRLLRRTGLRGDPEDLLVLRWALLLHDVSKPETLAEAPDGRPTFHGHEVLGASRARAIMERLRFPGARRRRVERLVRAHLRPHQLGDAGAPVRGLRRLVHDAGEDLPLLLAHALCDARGSGGPEAPARVRRLARVVRLLRSMHEQAREVPLPRLLRGEDVMAALRVGQGPEVGRALRTVREAQEEGEITTREEALALLTRGAPGSARPAPVPPPADPPASAGHGSAGARPRRG